jgi:hypothetical protein
VWWALVVLALVAPQEPAEPAQPPRRALTRERLLGDLGAIADAARRLAELTEAEEARRLAERVRALAEELREDLESPPPAADGAPEEATPAGLLPRVRTRFRRADPERWMPPAATRTISSEWGTTPKDGGGGATSNRVFKGERHAARAPGRAVFTTFTEPHRNFTFQDCVFEGAPGADGVVRTRWGIRAYDVIDWRFLRCEWRNLPDEHGCYLSAPGSVSWQKCRFEGIGSQAIQVVFRTEGAGASETSNPGLGKLGGLQHVAECLFLECGKPSGGRPSYALSFFEGPSADVRIEGCYLRTLSSPHLDPQGVPSSSYGAIMVHGRPRVELLDTFVHYARPDRDVIQIWNAEEVLIQDCEIVEGTIELRNCKRVRVTGCTGGARLIVGSGVDYVWPMASVRHEGPISDDYGH